MVRVATLPETADQLKLRELISGDQLAVSSDGLCAGYILASSMTTETVVHSHFGPLGPTFLRPSGRMDEGTRILRVCDSHLLVWGRAQGHPAGMWLLAPGHSAFLLRLDLIEYEPATRAVKGVDVNRPGQIIHLTGWGFWPVEETAIVTPDNDGLSVIETLAGHPHAYRAHAQGVTGLCVLTLEDASRAVGVVRWRGHLMLAVARASQSWLTQLDRGAQGQTLERVALDGDFCGAWASPKGETLAILVHPRGTHSDVRRLQLSDGRIVHEGAFKMDAASLRWSANHNELAVRISQRDGFVRGFRERIVGTSVDHSIAHGLHVREMLVDDAGRLAALIQHDGRCDQPIVAGRAGTKVPLAWNLHHTSDGHTSWTTVHGDRILTWVQESPAVRVVGHALR